MNYWILALPVVSAAFAWLIVYIASEYLLKKIIPSRQRMLAEKLGLVISQQFSLAPLEQKITDPSNVRSIMPVVETHIDDFLRHKLKQKMPMIGMLIGDKTIQSLKDVFLKEIEEMFPQVLAGFAGNLKAQLDIRGMVTSKLLAIPSKQISNGLSPVVRYFTYVAIVTGFVIGLINALLIYLLPV